MLQGLSLYYMGTWSPRVKELLVTRVLGFVVLQWEPAIIIV